MHIRKDAARLTAAEQTAFINAVTQMVRDGSYQQMARIHSDMRYNMHGGMGATGTQRFLPWHRAYLRRMESELRRRSANTFIPYLNWFGGIPPWLNNFRPTIAGIRNARSSTLSGIANRINTLVQTSNFTTFTRALETGEHNRVHVALGTPMNNTSNAPYDPIFWMHHAMVDYVWALWQQRWQLSGPTLTGANAVMNPWPDTVASLSPISRLDYRYA